MSESQPSASAAHANQPSGSPDLPRSSYLQSSAETISMQANPDSGAPIPPLPSNRNASNSSERIPHWLQQGERLLRVIVRMYLGLLVCFAPWYPPAWDANPLFAHSPWLMTFITQGAVRGVISGLGLLNLWIALYDALHPPAEPLIR